MAATSLTFQNFAGFILLYSDGTVLKSSQTSWLLAPSADLLIMNVYSAETYQRWIDGHWVTENWMKCFCGCDYYWKVPGEHTYGMGDLLDVPAGAEVKLGILVPDDEFYLAYNAYHDFRIWAP